MLGLFFAQLVVAMLLKPTFELRQARYQGSTQDLTLTAVAKNVRLLFLESKWLLSRSNATDDTPPKLR
jgi:hypothetical protein